MDLQLDIWRTTFFVLAACLSTGIALKCFQCSSAEDPTCLDLLQNDTASPYYKDCEDKFGHKPILCRKTVYSIKGGPENFKRVSRSCGWELHKTNDSKCVKFDSDFKMETSCQCFTDACNGARSTVQYSRWNVLPAVCILAYFTFL